MDLNGELDSSSMDAKQCGDKIYAHLANEYPYLAGKITGMLMELGEDEVGLVCNNPTQLKQKVIECLEVLAKAENVKHELSPEQQDELNNYMRSRDGQEKETRKYSGHNSGSNQNSGFARHQHHHTQQPPNVFTPQNEDSPPERRTVLNEIDYELDQQKQHQMHQHQQHQTRMSYRHQYRVYPPQTSNPYQPFIPPSQGTQQRQHQHQHQHQHQQHHHHHQQQSHHHHHHNPMTGGQSPSTQPRTRKPNYNQYDSPGQMPFHNLPSPNQRTHHHHHQHHMSNNNQSNRRYQNGPYTNSPGNPQNLQLQPAHNSMPPSPQQPPHLQHTHGRPSPPPSPNVGQLPQKYMTGPPPPSPGTSYLPPVPMTDVEQPSLLDDISNQLALARHTSNDLAQENQVLRRKIDILSRAANGIPTKEIMATMALIDLERLQAQLKEASANVDDIMRHRNFSVSICDVCFKKPKAVVLVPCQDFLCENCAENNLCGKCGEGIQERRYHGYTPA